MSTEEMRQENSINFPPFPPSNLLSLPPSQTSQLQSGKSHDIKSNYKPNFPFNKTFYLRKFHPLMASPTSSISWGEGGERILL